MPFPASINAKVPAALTPQERELHVLNRFTFGPTPEDMESIHALGIDRWFEQQLNPDRIAVTTGDQQLSARLAEFPAMQLPVPMLLDRFPSSAETRQAANGKIAIPDDPILAAIYKRHIALYEEKQEKKAAAQANQTEAAAQDVSMSGPAAKPEPAAQTQARNSTGMDASASAMSMAAAMDDEIGNASVNSGIAKTPSIKAAKMVDAPRPAYEDSMVKNVLALAPNKRVSRILNMPPAEYKTLQSSLKGPQKLQLIQDLSPYQREILSDYDHPTRAVIEELQGQRLLRDIYSSHQLQEVMTTFWLNHFNVYLHKNEETPYYLVSFERDVIRPRALGNFENLLVATAESPAMLLYLDNSSSTGPDSMTAEKQKQRIAFGKSNKATPAGLNENYARELMELHTLGVNGGYTQKDVTEVAKVFTGWTVDHPQQGGGFRFDEARHEPGKKLVLGTKIKEDGQREGLQLLHTLATSPATARFISQKLAIAFVSDTPSRALVDRMAQTFVRTHGEIAAVLRTMLHSPEFWAPQAYQAKVKTPLEYVVSAARASRADIANMQPLVNALNQMGMPLYGCVPPTGWSAKADEWVSTGALVTRMNFGLTLASNRYPGIKADWSNAPESTVIADSTGKTGPPGAKGGLNEPPAPLADPASDEQRLEARLLPTGMSEKTRSAVLAQVQPQPVAQTPAGAAKSMPINQLANSPASQPATEDKQLSLLAGLLIGSPEFQRR